MFGDEKFPINSLLGENNGELRQQRRRRQRERQKNNRFGSAKQ